MGINGLLGLLKEIQQPTHLQAFRGQTIAVDGYVWLYRGCFSCALELGLGLPTDKFLSFCINRIQLLLHYDIQPYIVFDGADLPMKQVTNESRKKKRDAYREEGKMYMARGNKKKALDCFQKALEVTPEIAYKFIQYLRKQKIPFMVAPYEADAQLVYLQKHNVVSAILTEDSDLLVFGATKVLFKLENDGSCQLIQLNLHLPKLKVLNFVNWTHDQFIHMCILSGCDYLPSLPQIGLMKAYKYLKRSASLESVFRCLKMDGHSVTSLYCHQFQLAKWTFLYQRVFCPFTQGLTYLTSPLPTCLINQSTEFLGPWIPNDLAKAIALGQVHPITHQPFSPSSSSSLLFNVTSTSSTLLSHTQSTSLSFSFTQQQQQQPQEEEVPSQTSSLSSTFHFNPSTTFLTTETTTSIEPLQHMARLQVASGLKKKFSISSSNMKPFQFRSKPMSLLHQTHPNPSQKVEKEEEKEEVNEEEKNENEKENENENTSLLLLLPTPETTSSTSTNEIMEVENLKKEQDTISKSLPTILLFSSSSSSSISSFTFTSPCSSPCFQDKKEDTQAEFKEKEDEKKEQLLSSTKLLHSKLPQPSFSKLHSSSSSSSLKRKRRSGHSFMATSSTPSPSSSTSKKTSSPLNTKTRNLLDYFKKT